MLSGKLIRRPNRNPRQRSAWENERGGRYGNHSDPPDSLYRKSERLAALRGTTVEQLIVEAVQKEVQCAGESGTAGLDCDRDVELPVIHSQRPGTLDLAHFDFDDLLTR